MSEFHSLPSTHDYVRNGYDMSLEEVQSLGRQLLEQRPPAVNDRYVCYEIDGDDPFADIGRFVERDRFEEAFNNTPGEMHREYAPYENASTFFISMDVERYTPAGALRIIWNSDAGLKTVNDVGGPPLHLTSERIQQEHSIASFDDTWDIGTVATIHGYPPGRASLQLYRGAYLAAMRENIQHVVSVIDTNVLPGLTNSLGFPFVSLAGTPAFEYLGSKSSQAVYGHVPEFYDNITNHQKLADRRLAERVLDRLIVGTDDHTYIAK